MRTTLVFAFLLIPGIAYGADRVRALAQVVAGAASQRQPTITVLPAASGAPLQSYTPGSASLSFGQAAYYGGHLAPGVAAQKNSGAMILTTRFGLRVDCPVGSPSPSVQVSMSLLDMDPSYVVSVDGRTLTSAPFVVPQWCGSVAEHRVDVEIPKTKLAGPIANTLSFSVAQKY